jgi:hypothetical protein
MYRGIEKDALDRKDARPKKVLQAKPLALPPLAKPPYTVIPLRAVSRITPTPAPRRAAVIRMPAVAVAVANDDSSDAESHDKREHLPPELPIWPACASRPQCCPRCYQEDCVGCTCLCADFDEWFDPSWWSLFSELRLAACAKGKIVRDICVFALPAPFGRSMGVTKSKMF